MSDLQLDLFKNSLEIILRDEDLSFWVPTTSLKGFSQNNLYQSERSAMKKMNTDKVAHHEMFSST